jgi:CRP/FNR family transcriptional regulator, nitrogen fixation regulation protein
MSASLTVAPRTRKAGIAAVFDVDRTGPDRRPRRDGRDVKRGIPNPDQAALPAWIMQPSTVARARQGNRPATLDRRVACSEQRIANECSRVPDPSERLPGGMGGAVTHVAADCQIFAEGDEARSFYKVISGTVRTCRFLHDGRRRINAFHKPGGIFGLDAGAVYDLSAEAVSNCIVVAYPRRGLEAMVVQDVRLGSWFFSHALNEAARAREHAMLLGRCNAVQKISTFLLDGSGASKGAVDLVMSRQDIADYLNLTIETVSRTLSQLERDGTIELPTARHVVIRNEPALRAMVT